MFVNCEDDLKSLEKEKINIKQNIQYICIKCNTKVERPLYRLKAKNYKLLCRKCSFKESSKRTWNNKNEEEKKQIREKREKTFLEKYSKSFLDSFRVF